MGKLRDIQSHDIYLAVISILGFLFVGWGFILIPSYTPKLNFFLLAILAAAAQIATTSVSVSKKAGITFEVGTAVTIAATPLFGPAAAALLAAISSLSIWLIQPANKITWKKSWKQLCFNVGMHSVAMFISGWAFLAARTFFGADTFWGAAISWLIVAIVYDQANFWLLMIMVRLQHGQHINPLSIWKENQWAMPINILTISIGGGMLAFAVDRFDWIGIVIFFLPIILSAYSFRLYVNQMQTHMDNLEGIIAERTQKLADLMKEKDAFLAVLSHDMKTPLTSISIYASMIRDHPHLVMEKPHMAGTILRSQQTLTDLVNNILDLEKLQADGVIPLEKEKLDMALLIESVVEPLKAQASQKQIDLQYQVDSKLRILKADRGQIERVIQNLISNAVKYTPDGGCVTVRAYMDDQAVVTEIKDNGYGIPTGELPYVFDRFNRVSKLKYVAAGTGLGLAIAKAIVEAHDGTISVNSEEDVGSTFFIRLPFNNN